MPLAVARNTEPTLAAGGVGEGRCRNKPAATRAVTLAQAASVRAPDKVPNDANHPAVRPPPTHSPAARPRRILAFISAARRFQEMAGNSFSAARLSRADANA